MIESNSSSEKAIYSKWAILGFCLFFSPIFGGFMLRKNFRGIRKNAEGNIVFLVSIMMAFLTALLASTPYGGAGTTIFANFLQGALLVEFSFKKYFIDADDLPKKSVLPMLSASLMIVAVLLMLLILLGAPVQ
jgi:hypothetical protein